MINLKEKIEEYKLRKQLRRVYVVDKQFLQLARERFLRQISSELSRGRIPIHHHVIRWRYALIVTLIAISMTAGVVTLADQNNVPLNHPLYPLKRLDEQIRLGLSSPQQQVTLHQQFAERRLNEIKEVQAGPADSQEPLESNLADDFQNEANITIDQAEQLNFGQSQRQAICQQLLGSVDHVVQDARMAHVHDHCQLLLKNK